MTEHDRFLIRKCDEAVRDGVALEQWCRRGGGTRTAFGLDLKQTFFLPNRADGYFGSIRLNGIDTSVMGCRQHIEFARVSRRRDAARLLKEFVLGEFLTRAHWVNPDGAPGGFGVERSLYRTAGGQYGRFADDDRAGAVDWRDIGPRFRWVLLTIKLHDFALNLGPITRSMEEAVCVTPLPEFVRVVEYPTPEYALEVSIGYPFIDYAPIPNFFGFGPGKFGVAVKLFSFYLTHDNRIRVMMEFAAAPRARKVLDLWGVDPVYGGAALVDTLTMGLVDPEPVHELMDTGMLVQHCHVHQKLMDGASKQWEEWLAEAGY
ncbi:MAG: hypothetical protein NTV05_06170 [Acidobacteria bacterium]|nr:hypothetical protein [Acidobacteriota bacterium]